MWIGDIERPMKKPTTRAKKIKKIVFFENSSKTTVFRGGTATGFL
jgi:hypothetical protein